MAPTSLFVDEGFLTALAAGKVDQPALVAKVLPERTWHAEKVATFLTKLNNQAKDQEAL